MYKGLHYFIANQTIIAVFLPFNMDEIIREWGKLRSVMAKKLPSEFTRDEWAYLMTFLQKENLLLPFEETFGKRDNGNSTSVKYLARPRGAVALWLPNNVSLLGPLMLILLSLSGNPIHIKCGSQNKNLAVVFLDFCMQNISQGSLKTYLRESVTLEFFNRDDPRNREMAQRAVIRIVFGSDETAKAIESFPHPINSLGIYFVDKQSEAWVAKGALDDKVLEGIVKVFAIYGQAGCTSPRRIVIIDGDEDDAISLCQRLTELWPKTIRHLPAPNVASENIMAMQQARALGWNAKAIESNAAVLATGQADLPVLTSPMFLPIVWARREDALKSLPENIQTLGYAFNSIGSEDWLAKIAATNVKRFVPIALMHHFSHVWDGYAFWKELFEEVNIHLDNYE